MADKNISLEQLDILNDSSLIFLRRAVKLLESQYSEGQISPKSSVGTITITSIPNLDETFIIGSQTFIWKDLRSATGEVTRGVNGFEAINNLITAVNIDLPSLVIASVPPGNANSIFTITSIPVTKGTGYKVGDILTLCDGIGGSVIVLTISGNGLVETTALYTIGCNYTVGNKTCSGGYGTGCVVTITALGNPPVNVSAILKINPIPSTKGTGYKVGDILNVTGGIGGKVKVETISGAGLVETISLYDYGTGYIVGQTGNNLCTGGYGTGCIIIITAIQNEATAFITSILPGIGGNTIPFLSNSINMVMNGSGFLGGTILGSDASMSNRQRISIDAVGAAPTEGTTSMPINVAAGTQFLGYVGIANTAVAGFSFPVDQREHEILSSRRAFLRIREKLTFS